MLSLRAHCTTIRQYLARGHPLAPCMVAGNQFVHVVDMQVRCTGCGTYTVRVRARVRMRMHVSRLTQLPVALRLRRHHNGMERTCPLATFRTI